jgi:hypothetical protein
LTCLPSFPDTTIIQKTIRAESKVYITNFLSNSSLNVFDDGAV